MSPALPRPLPRAGGEKVGRETADESPLPDGERAGVRVPP